MLKNAVGRPVAGTNFYDREAERRTLWAMIDTDNLLLLAPRRVGKTSLMYRLVEEADVCGFQATFASVAGAADEIEFVRALYDATAKTAAGKDILRRIAAGPVGSLLKNIQKIDISGFSLEFKAAAKKDWEQVGAALSHTLEGYDGRWLLLVDEIPLFVMKLLRLDPTGRRARHFLDWFRDLRQKHESVRWFLAGSIGLDTVVARYNMSDTINDLHLQRLGPFDEPTAHRFLIALGDSYGISLDEATRSHLIARAAWPIPYFLQLLFSEIRKLPNPAHGVGAAEVDQAFNCLLEPACKNYFDYWRQRLHDELGPPDDKLALAILSAAARDPQGASRQTLRQLIAARTTDPDQQESRLRYLLDILVNDGYLHEEDGRFPFRSPLLREFWLRRLG